MDVISPMDGWCIVDGTLHYPVHPTDLLFSWVGNYWRAIGDESNVTTFILAGLYSQLLIA